MGRSTSKAGPSKTRAWLDEIADEQDHPICTMDGYDDCIVGVCHRFGDAGHQTFVVYDREKVIRNLMGQGMNEEEAEGFHDFNQAGAFVGEGTPGFLVRPPK